MSTFNGQMKECNAISIDNFTRHNLHSTAFFLSHCHQDHMYGLTEPAFLQRLSQGYPLYCHHITKELLLSDGDGRYNHLEPFIISKDVNVSFDIAINVDDDDSLGTMDVTVTFLPAKHCPGSVMILFEFPTGANTLYTGDFRLTGADWQQFDALRISPMSTFCHDHLDMPSREQSKTRLIRQIKRWLDANVENKVLIWSYGNAKTARVHACAYWRENDYSESGTIAAADDDEVVILEGDEAASGCSRSRSASPSPKKRGFHGRGWRQIPSCQDCRPENENILVIKPSMMWFAMQKTRNVIGFEDSDRFYRLLYSCHSSLAEVKDAFIYLKPRKAYPNVVGRRAGGEARIMANFAEFLTESSRLPVTKSLNGSFFGELNGCHNLSPIKYPNRDPTAYAAYVREAESSSAISIQFLDEMQTTEQERLTIVTTPVGSAKKTHGISDRKSPLCVTPPPTIAYSDFEFESETTASKSNSNNGSEKFCLNDAKFDQFPKTPPPTISYADFDEEEKMVELTDLHVNGEVDARLVKTPPPNISYLQFEEEEEEIVDNGGFEEARSEGADFFDSVASEDKEEKASSDEEQSLSLNISSSESSQRASDKDFFGESAV